MIAETEISFVIFGEKALHRRVQTADKGQPYKPAVSVTAEHKVNVPERVRPVEDEGVRHMRKAYPRNVGVLKILEKAVFGRRSELLLGSSEIKAVSHRTADAQRLTADGDVGIVVVHKHSSRGCHPIGKVRVRSHVFKLVVSRRKKDRSNITKLFYEPGQRLDILLTGAAADHISDKADGIRLLLADLGDQPRIVLAERLAVQIGNEHKTHSVRNAIDIHPIRRHIEPDRTHYRGYRDRQETDRDRRRNDPP